MHRTSDVEPRPARRIRTILYGDQKVLPAELELLHTPSLQRLYSLHQLGMTDRVFIDASHSRLHHVVGVMEQASKLMRAISTNLRSREREFLIVSRDKYKRVPSQRLSRLVLDYESKARMVGLLHDLAHSPFGHTLEDEIELVSSKHDEVSRQADAFHRLLLELLWCWFQDCGFYSDTNETDAPLTVQSVLRKPATQSAMRLLRDFVCGGVLAKAPATVRFENALLALVDALLTDSACRPLIGGRGPNARELRSLLADFRFATTALYHLELLHKQKPEKKHLPPKDAPVQRLLDKIIQNCEGSVRLASEFRPREHAYILDVIGNTICADLLDYAHRDSLFANLKLDYDSDRIVENMTLVEYEDNKRVWQLIGADPFSGRILRTAIDVFSHKLRMDVPGALLHLLHVRFYVFQRALFHPTKCTAGAMLGTALQMLGFSRNTFPQHLQLLGDDVFLHQLRESTRLALTILSSIGRRRRSNASVSLVLRLARKRLRNAVDIGSERTALDILSARAALSDGKKLTELHSDCGWIVPDKTRSEVGVSIQELTAAGRLLERLNARRYFRPVFRLLPNVGLPLASMSHETVADTFLNPIVRWHAERSIEREARVPLGSVVMHSPSALGPRKIAMILIVWRGRDGREEARPLREIGKLDADLFGEVQTAVEALERMYASMWRLVVSVDPRLHTSAAQVRRTSMGNTVRPKSLEAIVGRVLGRMTRGNANPALDRGETLPNDWTMQEELRLAAERK